MLLCFRAGEY